MQLNKYNTGPYFPQFFQSNTTVCLIIYVFCKSSEPEIGFVWSVFLQNNFMVANLTKLANRYSVALQWCCLLEVPRDHLFMVFLIQNFMNVTLFITFPSALFNPCMKIKYSFEVVNYSLLWSLFMKCFWLCPCAYLSR